MKPLYQKIRTYSRHLIEHKDEEIPLLGIIIIIIIITFFYK